MRELVRMLEGTGWRVIGERWANRPRRDPVTLELRVRRKAEPRTHKENAA